MDGISPQMMIKLLLYTKISNNDFFPSTWGQAIAVKLLTTGPVLL